MAINYRNRAQIVEKYPEMGEAFDDIISHLQHIMTQTNTTPPGTKVHVPAAPVALKVTAAHGIFDASITDNSHVARGVNYFLEYSTNPSFTAPHTIDLGQSGNHRVNLGNQTLYWRAHSSYPTGPRSSPVYHGNEIAPQPVNGGGPFSGPVIQDSQGSGTSYGASGSDGGFGNNQRRVKSV